MRYYNIAITDPVTGAAITPSSLNGMPITSLLPGGGTNVAALNVEFDIPVASFHLPAGQAFVRIWGLGIKDLGGAFNLGPTTSKPGAFVSVSAGMAKGLPLANPAQARLLIKGQVLQAFGNWVGLDQTVDLILTTPYSGSPTSPANYVLNWKAGQTLADALSSTLGTAMPGMKQVINISSNLVLNHDQQGFYQSATQLAQFLNPLSRAIVTTAGYAGVEIHSDGQTVTVSDGTTPPATNIMVNFQDLLGQPTWIEPLVIQAKLVMRGDINLGDMVTLPNGIVTTTAAAMASFTGSNPSNELTFSGPYMVQKIHHFGNFRQPDGASWNTTVDMSLMPQGTKQ